MSGLWRLADPLLLASASETRRAMLEAAGIPVEVLPASLDERAIEARLAGTAPGAVAAALAEAKARNVAAIRPGRLVLGADQTLACDGARFHKPADAAAAKAQLLALAGRTHELCSAFALVRDGTLVAAGSDSARLTMRPFDADFIDLYFAAAGPAVFGSVGAYQVEALGAQLFERIDGDHFTILGLQLLALCAALRAYGALAG